MLSYVLTQILPFLIALIGGVLVGTSLRPVAKSLAKESHLTKEQSYGRILFSAGKVSFGLAIVVTILAVTKYTLSYQAVITAIYLVFLIFSILWGIFMGLLQNFITAQNAIKILRNL